MNADTTVKRIASTTNPRAQRQIVKNSDQEFSHHEWLPLLFDVRPTQGWFCRRRIRVKTLEKMWFRNALVHSEIPSDRISDLGSIPPAAWSFISPVEIAVESLHHDEGYSQQPAGIERREWDNLLLTMMKKRGKPWYVRWSAYLLVRAFGGKAWEHHRRRNARLERVKHAANGGE